MAGGSPANRVDAVAKSWDRRAHAGRQIVGEVGFHRGPVEQMVFGELFARRRRLLEIEHRAYQALRRYRGAAASQAFLANHGSERGAGGIATDHEPVRVDAERRGLAGYPMRSRRSHPRWPPGICVRAPAGSPRKPAGSRWFAPAPPRCGRGSRCCRRPCRRHGRTRIPAGLAARIGGRIEPVTKIARGARHYAVDRDRCRHVGAGELHEFPQRLTPLVRRRPYAIARRGRRHHLEQTLGSVSRGMAAPLRGF